MEIEILNWDKWNQKRNDVKNPTWLRLENKTPTSQDLFGLRAAHKWIWVCIICIASQKQKGCLDIDTDWLAWYSGSSKEEVLECIKQLEGRTLRIRTHTARARPQTYVTDGRTDEQTNEHYERESEKNSSTSQPIVSFKSEPTGLIEVLKGLPERVVEKFGDITERMQLIWVEKYPNIEWLQKQLIDAADFNDAKNECPSKGWSACFTVWLSRAHTWTPHKDAKPVDVSFAEFMRERGDDFD